MRKASFLAVLAMTTVGAMALAGAGSAAKPTGVSATPRVASSHFAANVVRQIGARNYAGPNCPGAGWNCTTATRVLQIATDGGQNVAQCNKKPVVTPGSLSCDITQSGRNNSANCVQTMNNTLTATEACMITQTGQQNRAVVFQLIVQNKGTGQTGTQTAEIKQGPGATGGTSLNDASVGQAVKQRIGGSSADDDDSNDDHGDGDHGDGDHGDRRLAAVDPSQVQDSYQSAVVTQNATGSGRNASRILQSERQREIGGNPQSQDATVGTMDCAPGHGQDNPNACANVSQSNVDGNNSNVLVQLENKLARTGVAGAIQHQGTPDGGLDGRVHQDTSPAGHSANQAYQSKTWTLTLPSGSQTQHDPAFCCGFASQDGGTGNSETINQTTKLKATGSSFPIQDANLTGESTQPTDGSGRCTITQFASVNRGSTPNSASESPCPFLLLQTSCVNVSEGSPCTPEDPITTPPDSPVSELSKCVANINRELSCRDTVPASGEQTLDYTINYTNGGNGTANNVTVTDTIPVGQDYIDGSCQAPDQSGATCLYDPDTRTVKFLFGPVSPDSSWDMSFQTSYACSGDGINVAQGRADQEVAPASSNPTTVTNSC